ncbi:bifunctional pyr operon transcriptional regulator/uracil phosphoribosyltransferase PyrR [Desulfohalobium retbaense]|uniref:Bifunctional protein PyrR n=1 Tax=Desulfohalobium retbaense (strain ATCC 49708 / DSM 5692 / JCM 16813 / HR100) TaxID=485915 RepID=C8X412_DESRD|nr:bifunctional pyr operon transcriptional regulator/uracil phosphoribosyltransferase PyrR [Desulfohalobium retbaense]ACV69159.1 Uracil phosphoribosyltransferase [Desulfohalobium retbaense DSM 5692]
MASTKTRQILSDGEFARTLERLAFEILERHDQSRRLALVGIQRRGVELADRLRRLLENRLGQEVPLGKLDINLYRDDWTTMESQPRISRTDIPFPVDDSQIILVDDVLYTGRTIRAALEAILDFGRPSRVELLVLVDRGHRELPIHADYVGKRLDTSKRERIDVLIQERDERDAVVLTEE